MARVDVGAALEAVCIWVKSNQLCLKRLQNLSYNYADQVCLMLLHTFRLCGAKGPT